jgi:demethoxyubiquinone hydroxylase (CLK1/Coq7/Cat5 family)
MPDSAPRPAHLLPRLVIVAFCLGAACALLIARACAA